MANRYNFTKSFQNEVCKVLSTIHRLTIKGEKDISDEIKAPVDLYYQDEMGKEYLIELEIHRADPSNNVAKIAYWLHEAKTKRDVTVIQFFSPHYQLKTTTSAKMEVSIYLGQTLIEREHDQKYHYITLDNDSPEEFEDIYSGFPKNVAPDQEALKSMKIMAKQLAEKIIGIIRQKTD